MRENFGYASSLSSAVRWKEAADSDKINHIS